MIEQHDSPSSSFYASESDIGKNKLSPRPTSITSVLGRQNTICCFDCGRLGHNSRLCSEDTSRVAMLLEETGRDLTKIEVRFTGNLNRYHVGFCLPASGVHFHFVKFCIRPANVRKFIFKSCPGLTPNQHTRTSSFF